MATNYELVLQLKPSGGTINPLFIPSEPIVWDFDSVLPFYSIPADTQLIWFFDDINADDDSVDPELHNVVVQGYSDILAKTPVKHAFASYGAYDVKAFLKLPDKYVRADKRIVISAPENFFIEPDSGIYVSPITVRMGCVDPTAPIFYTLDNTDPYDVKDRGTWTPTPPSGSYLFNDLVTASDGNTYRYTSRTSSSNPQPGIGMGWMDFWEQNGSTLYTQPFSLSTSSAVRATAFSKEFPTIGVFSRNYLFSIIPGVVWNHSSSVIYYDTISLIPSLVGVSPDEAALFNIVYTVTGGVPSIIFDPESPIIADRTITVKYFVIDIYGNNQGPTLTVTFRIVRYLTVTSLDILDVNDNVSLFLGGTPNSLLIKFSAPLNPTIVPIYGSTVRILNGATLFTGGVAAITPDNAGIAVSLAEDVPVWPDATLTLHIQSNAVRGIDGTYLASEYVASFTSAGSPTAVIDSVTVNSFTHDSDNSNTLNFSWTLHMAGYDTTQFRLFLKQGSTVLWFQDAPFGSGTASVPGIAGNPPVTFDGELSIALIDGVGTVATYDFEATNGWSDITGQTFWAPVVSNQGSSSLFETPGDIGTWGSWTSREPELFVKVIERDAVLHCMINSTGQVGSVRVYLGGTGFSVGNTFDVPCNNSSGNAVIYVDNVGSGGEILAMTVTDPGPINGFFISQDNSVFLHVTKNYLDFPPFVPTKMRVTFNREGVSDVNLSVLSLESDGSRNSLFGNALESGQEFDLDWISNSPSNIFFLEFSSGGSFTVTKIEWAQGTDPYVIPEWSTVTIDAGFNGSVYFQGPYDGLQRIFLNGEVIVPVVPSAGFQVGSIILDSQDITYSYDGMNQIIDLGAVDTDVSLSVGFVLG